MIKLTEVNKIYRRIARKEGFWGSVKTLFNAEYEEKYAVNNISFEIEEGEIVGYIGPNGAGKSTSIKMLTGILTPTSGNISVNGIVPYQDRKANAKQIGVVFGQKTQLWWDVPLIESLKLLRDIYQVSDSKFKSNLNLFSDLLQINEFQNIPVRQLSLGQRMRADLVAALIHDPKVLFLDEPTIGVDVVAKENLRKFIREINKEKRVTVLMTTHDMGDIEKLCSRMLMIDRGQITYDGSVEKIRKEYGTWRTLVIEFEHWIPDFTVPGTELIQSDGKKKWFRFNRNKVTPSILLKFISEKYEVLDLSVEEPQIEELVRSLYEGFTDESVV